MTAASGLLMSCATLEARRPTAASFSEIRTASSARFWRAIFRAISEDSGDLPGSVPYRRDGEGYRNLGAVFAPSPGLIVVQASSVARLVEHGAHGAFFTDAGEPEDRLPNHFLLGISEDEFRGSVPTGDYSPHPPR